jgi:hypothetical protein
VLAEGESLDTGSIDLFADGESRARVLDRMVFLTETEKAYFDDMRAYIRNDLGCRALVTGTIVFGPLGLYAQSGMDYIDSHAYWQHPRFPGRPWDPANWLVDQKAMTDYPEQATLFRLAAERLAGKPFTVSEYNHPAPLDSQAECVPMIASFAAAQDWDGIWLFTYSHSSNAWGREVLNNFFDMDTNPAKWGFMRAGTAIFRERRAAPLAASRGVRITSGSVADIAALGLQCGQDLLRILKAKAGNVTNDDMLQCILLPSYGDKPPITASFAHDRTELRWSVDGNGHGLYQMEARQARVYIGHAARFEEATAGRVRITAPQFLAMTLTVLDESRPASLEDSRKILVTACGRCENVGMGFSQDRRTVGRNRGTAPVQIEAVQSRLILPAGRWTCHALAPDGSPKQLVPIDYEGDQGALTLSPSHATMWYLLERSER